MTENTKEAPRTDEGTTEPDSEHDPGEDFGPLANPFDNWRKRGHVRAEPGMLREGMDEEKTQQSSEDS